MGGFMEVDEQLPTSSGIYKIQNKVNGKIYIGKTKNFRKRYTHYKSAFNKRDTKQINSYLMRSLEKYSPAQFKFSIIEECHIDLLAERELYWMDEFETTDCQKGYNLRRDSSTGMVAHQSTREKISRRVRREFEDGIRSREDLSKLATNIWKDGERRRGMALEVSKSKASYFIQMDRQGIVVAVYESIQQVLHSIPNSKWQNIYAACNGSKKTYLGYRWERSKDITGLEHLLVKTEYTHTQINKNTKYQDFRNESEETDN